MKKKILAGLMTFFVVAICVFNVNVGALNKESTIELTTIEALADTESQDPITNANQYLKYQGNKGNCNFPHCMNKKTG